MDARRVISKLRQTQPLTDAEMHWFGLNLASPEISDAQVGAFSMAVSLNGLAKSLRVALTKGMLESGDVLTWDLPGPVLDKHSTGGVGDPVSLLLAPALAACGAYVPMISGRGLGHTGGTLDKLEAITGYVSEVGAKRLNHVVKTVGCAIVGAGGHVAPSDKRLYAVRDVTGTVNSIDLITASILSKKLAAGLEGLVLDVKTGSGAFMRDPRDAKDLAKSLVEVANGAGCPTRALITDMSQPLADAAGNSVEISAVMSELTGQSKNARLREVTSRLGGEVLLGSGLAESAKVGSQMILRALESGAAVEIFGRMIAELGGPLDFEKNWHHCLPEAPVIREVRPEANGYLTEIDTLIIGEVVVNLGGGRTRETDVIDHSVGLSQMAPLGSKLDTQTPFAMVHAKDEATAEAAIQAIRKAIVLGETKPMVMPAVVEVIGP